MHSWLLPKCKATVLLCAGLGHVGPFLRKAMDAPDAAAVENAVARLEALGALDGDEALTPLGEALAQLPMDPAVGKLLLYGAVFDCLEPVLSIAASLSYKSPFVSPLERRAEADEAKRRMAEGLRSDHWALLAAVRRWQGLHDAGRRREAHDWARANFLLPKALDMICDMRTQLAQVRPAVSEGSCKFGERVVIHMSHELPVARLSQVQASPPACVRRCC
jgi:ATP-dependent RNA helicase DHX36